MAYGDLPAKKKRRITKLDVLEVSLVDRPANGEPFCLYKNEDGVGPESPLAAPVTEIPFGIQRFAPPEEPKHEDVKVDYDRESVSSSLELSKATMDRVLSSLEKKS